MSYASFWKRTAAYLIDGIFCQIITFIVSFVVGFILGVSGHSSMAGTAGTILGIATWIVYFVWAESSAWQATIGKRMFGLKVTDLNGQRISFWRSLGRNVAMIISTLILCIGYLMCFWTEKKQCLHDSLAGCLVIDEKPNEKQGCAVWAIIGFFVLLIGTLVLGILAAIALPQFERALGNMAAKNLEAARKVQNTYYKEHNQYATRWNQLNFVEECNNEESNRCVLANLFTLELEPEGVAAQRENPKFSYRLFRAYDLNDTRRNLVCISKDERVKSFCQRLVERQGVPSRSKTRTHATTVASDEKVWVSQAKTLMNKIQAAQQEYFNAHQDYATSWYQFGMPVTEDADICLTPDQTCARHHKLQAMLGSKEIRIFRINVYENESYELVLPYLAGSTLRCEAEGDVCDRLGF